MDKDIVKAIRFHKESLKKKNINFCNFSILNRKIFCVCLDIINTNTICIHVFIFLEILYFTTCTLRRREINYEM